MINTYPYLYTSHSLASSTRSQSVTCSLREASERHDHRYSIIARAGPGIWSPHATKFFFSAREILIYTRGWSINNIMKQTQEDMLISEAYNKVNQVTEASTNDGADNMLMRAQKLIESNPNLNNITIQTHNGNIELPIMEMWVQDGVLKISVNHSSLQNSMNGNN